jgi:hypothetical protein
VTDRSSGRQVKSDSTVSLPDVPVIAFQGAADRLPAGAIRITPLDAS